LERILKALKKFDVKYLTFWGSSRDNLDKRPIQEKEHLLRIYKKYFEKIIKSKEVVENRMRINVLGDWEKLFPVSLKKTIKKAIEKTKHYDNYFVTFLLAYSGDKEMERALRNIAIDYKKGIIRSVDSGVIKNYLYTKDLPYVDLLIRSGSGNDPHLSNGFMMWDIKDAQLYFSNKAWPDFDQQELEKAIYDYQKRKRRFGK
jgi:undecaprenyl diphosphate synthase